MLHVLRSVQIADRQGRGAPDLLPRHRRRADRLHLRGPARLHLRHRSSQTIPRPRSARPARSPRSRSPRSRSSPPTNPDPKKLAAAIIALGRARTSHLRSRPSVAAHRQGRSTPSPTRPRSARSPRSSATTSNCETASRRGSASSAATCAAAPSSCSTAACWSRRRRRGRTPAPTTPRSRSPRRSSSTPSNRSATRPARTRPPTKRVEAQVLRRAPRPQGRRHRLRLRRVPGRRRPLPRRTPRRGLDSRGPRQRPRATTSTPGPSARSSPTASTAPTSTTWPSRCASSRSGSSRSTATCRSPSSTTRSSSATRCSASPASTSSASCTSTQRGHRWTDGSTSSTSTSTPSSARPSTCASASPPRSTRTTPPATAPPSAASSPSCTRVTADLRQIADGVIAAGLPLGGKPGKALDEAYENLRAGRQEGAPWADGGQPIHWLDSIIDGPHTTVPTDYDRWQPLHWVIEAPDVIVEHGGFDAVIGNPPFPWRAEAHRALWVPMSRLACQRARRRAGQARTWSRTSSCERSTARHAGTLGLIATNTIAQGDTREVGLDRLSRIGFDITRAIQSRPWPSRAPTSSSPRSGAPWRRSPSDVRTDLRRRRVASDHRRFSNRRTSRRAIPTPEGERGDRLQRMLSSSAWASCLNRDEAAELDRGRPENARTSSFPISTVRTSTRGPTARPLDGSSTSTIDRLEALRVLRAAFERVQRTWSDLEREKVNRAGDARATGGSTPRTPAMACVCAIAGLAIAVVVTLVSKTVMPVGFRRSGLQQALCCLRDGSLRATQAVLSSTAAPVVGYQVWVRHCGPTSSTRLPTSLRHFPVPTSTRPI